MYRCLSLSLLALLAWPALATPRFVTPVERSSNLDQRDGNDPFDSRIEFGWYTQGERSTLGQETIIDGIRTTKEVANYSMTRQVIEPKLRIGLFSRLALFVEFPMVVGWRQTWEATDSFHNEDMVYQGVEPDPDSRYTFGVPALQRTPTATLREGYDAPIHETFRRSYVGDLRAGITFDVLSEIVDPSKPTWLWEFWSRFPSGMPMEPTYRGEDTDLEGRTPRAGNTANTATESNPGGVSQGYYRFGVRTTLGRWVGKARPYFSVGYSFGHAMQNDRYDSQNLYEHAGFLDPSPEDGDNPFDLPPDHLADSCPVTTGQVHARCRRKSMTLQNQPLTLDHGAGLVPSHIGETEFGVSTNLWKTGGYQGSYIKLDVMVRGEYHSEGRELTRMADLLGRPTFQEQFARTGFGAGLRFAHAGIIEARVLGSLGQETSHFTTFEDYGQADIDDPGDVGKTAADDTYRSINEAYEYSPYHRSAFDGVGNRLRLLTNSFSSVNVDLRIRF
ncbi:MAG: hypothetical protein CMH58_05200 [Myxococcales bacterium]|nr:hypothetical protein [Myxococcales bacterium]